LDHRKSRALFVPVEIQKRNTYPKAVGFASLLVPSIIDAISSSAKMQNPYTMHSFVRHPAPKRPLGSTKTQDSQVTDQCSRHLFFAQTDGPLRPPLS
jgi:hypothetical protein